MNPYLLIFRYELDLSHYITILIYLLNNDCNKNAPHLCKAFLLKGGYPFRIPYDKTSMELFVGVDFYPIS